MCPSSDGDARCLSGGVRSSAGLARRRQGGPAARVAKDLGVAESRLRRWVDRQAGREPGVASGERDGLVRLHRENRELRMERDLLSRAAALFATENVLPWRRY
jgi:transposase